MAISEEWFPKWTEKLNEAEHLPLKEFLQSLAVRKGWPSSIPELKKLYDAFAGKLSKDREIPPASKVVYLLMRKKLIMSNGREISWAPPHPESFSEEPSKLVLEWRKLSQKFCRECMIHFASEEELQKHTSFLHSSDPYEQREDFPCKICGINFVSEFSLSSHETTPFHLSRLAADKLNKDRARLERNKGKVIVEMPEIMQQSLDPRVLDVGQEIVVNLSIYNSGFAPREFTSCIVLPLDTEELVFRLDNGPNEDPKWKSGELLDHKMTLMPCFKISVVVKISAKYVGELRAIIVFSFDNFTIARYLELKIQDDIILSLAPTEPFQSQERKLVAEKLPNQQIVPGERPNFGHSMPPLPQYKVPKGIREQVEQKNLVAIINFLKTPRTIETYQDQFFSLLHLEEIQQEVDIESYNMSGVTFVEFNRYHVLKVPGLAERRPSVVKGDSVLVTYPGGTQIFEGCVHKITKEEVHLKFHVNFKPIKGEKCDVRFRFNRLLIRRAKHSIKLAAVSLHPNVLLPETLPPALMNLGSLPELKPMKWQLNEEQTEAVQNIISRFQKLQDAESDTDFPPYLIYGPPGTGKTTTLVECIWQILRLFPEVRILACAPSNSAADNIVRRLKGVLQKRHLVRVMAATRSRDSVDAEIMDHCRYDSERDVFVTPGVPELSAALVVVTTCFSASLIDCAGIKRGHFSFIFVDEAGHAQEPEGILPAASLLGPKSTLVLVGDPFQLGPIVRSSVSSRFGLQVSLLQRLMSLPLYDAYANEDKEDPELDVYQGFNPCLVTKLVKNYRSHPAIIRVPSEMFYEGELQACAEEMGRESLCRWEGLLNRAQFPVLFHGVIGKDEREGSSPSFFNPAEVSEVKRYVEKLRDTRGVRVTLGEIAVVTPYRKQVEKLRTVFQAAGMAAVKVGSVEEFQGQESRVLIISTVRSSEDFLAFDCKHQLGFLSNPKRFNVAITRAKQLLIVVGNPNVLANDFCWGSFIKYCIQNNAYVGCPAPQFAQQDSGEDAGRSSLVATLLGLNLDDTKSQVDGFEDAEFDDNGVDFSAVTMAEFPEWPDASV